MTTRTDALSDAMRALDEMSKTAPVLRRGSLVDRARVVLDIARFLVGEDVTEKESEEEPSTASTVAVGPARRVPCSVSPGDYAYVRACKVGQRPAVGLEIGADGESAQVVLGVRDARAYAAGILDAADEAEGGSPLLYFEHPTGRDG